MNDISKISYFIVDKFKSNTLVNTIAYEKTSEMDWNKENIYPLVNIDVTNSLLTNNLINVVYTITIVEARDIEPVLNNDKLFGSNLIDNLNETHTIAVKFINEVTKQQNDFNIDVVETTDIEMLKLDKGALDGVRFTITLSTPNYISSCSSTSTVWPDTYSHDNDYFKIYGNKGIIFNDHTGESMRTSEGDVYLQPDNMEESETFTVIGLDADGKIIKGILPSGFTDSRTIAAHLSGSSISFDNNVYGANYYNVNLSPLLNPKANLSGATFSGAISAPTISAQVLAIKNTGGTTTMNVTGTGTVEAVQYKLSALNTAPATSTSTGVLGEIRVTSTYIYICTATNVWVRTALSTF